MRCRCARIHVYVYLSLSLYLYHSSHWIEITYSALFHLFGVKKIQKVYEAFLYNFVYTAPTRALSFSFLSFFPTYSRGHA